MHCLGFLFKLFTVLLVGWLFAYWPAILLNQSSGAVWLTVAAGVMFFSGVAGLILVRVLKQSHTFAEVLLHSGNRAIWILGSVILVKTLRPDVGFSEFYGWLIFFYVQLMVLEVLALRNQSSKPTVAALNPSTTQTSKSSSETAPG